MGESARFRSGEALPRTSPWFDGQRVLLTAARGETLGIAIWHRGGEAVTLTVPGAHVQGYDVALVRVTHASTDMYGTSRGAGSYPDELQPAATPTSNPAYFTIEVPVGATPGDVTGELAVGATKYPVQAHVAPVVLPPLAIGAWAEDNPRELQWAKVDEPQCTKLFRDRGVLLSPPIQIADWPQRKALVGDAPFVPVDLGDPAADVPAWIAATNGTGTIPFAIPIDEPKPETRAKVRELAQRVRDAGGGAGRFLFAVTDEPRQEYGDLVDLYITLKPKLTDMYPHWTYNGAPPRAGSMVVDSPNPGPRTWGWIAWRYRIPIWYAWDALYWHDRHNNHDRDEMGRPKSHGRELHAGSDALSFDNGDDKGNLDGVLALPGPDGTCHSTLRLEAVRRGLEDRALLELAAKCDAAATANIATQLVPTALGDASGEASWPTDEAAWEAARKQLLALAACGT